MSLANLTFMLKKWETSRSQIDYVRKKVFLDELNLPINFLRHKDDADRYHVLASDDRTGQAIGTGSIHRDGHIGRIAILNDWREEPAVGYMIVGYLMHIARALRLDTVWINAHMNDMIDYFVQQDFYPINEPFTYCGVTMQKIESCIDPKTHRYVHKPPAPLN